MKLFKITLLLVLVSLLATSIVSNAQEPFAPSLGTPGKAAQIKGRLYVNDIVHLPYRTDLINYDIPLRPGGLVTIEDLLAPGDAVPYFWKGPTAGFVKLLSEGDISSTFDGGAYRDITGISDTSFSLDRGDGTRDTIVIVGGSGGNQNLQGVLTIGSTLNNPNAIVTTGYPLTINSSNNTLLINDSVFSVINTRGPMTNYFAQTSPLNVAKTTIRTAGVDGVDSTESQIELNGSTISFKGGYEATPEYMYLNSLGVQINKLAGTGNRLVYSNASGILGNLKLGTGVSISNDTLYGTGGPGSTPTLNDVTTAGNTTSDEVHLADVYVGGFLRGSNMQWANSGFLNSLKTVTLSSSRDLYLPARAATDTIATLYDLRLAIPGGTPTLDQVLAAGSVVNTNRTISGTGTIGITNPFYVSNSDGFGNAASVDMTDGTGVGISANAFVGGQHNFSVGNTVVRSQWAQAANYNRIDLSKDSLVMSTTNANFFLNIKKLPNKASLLSTDSVMVADNNGRFFKADKTLFDSPIPTLEQVLIAGNSADNSITLVGSQGINFSGYGDGTDPMRIGGQGSNFLFVRNADVSSVVAAFKFNLISGANKDFTFPNQSGTVALTSDVLAVNNASYQSITTLDDTSFTINRGDGSKDTISIAYGNPGSFFFPDQTSPGPTIHDGNLNSMYLSNMGTFTIFSPNAAGSGSGFQIDSTTLSFAYTKSLGLRAGMNAYQDENNKVNWIIDATDSIKIQHGGGVVSDSANWYMVVQRKGTGGALGRAYWPVGGSSAGGFFSPNQTSMGNTAHILGNYNFQIDSVGGIAFSQGDAGPNVDAILSLYGTKGLLLPSMITADRTSLNTNGLILYDETENEFYGKTPTGWKKLLLVSRFGEAGEDDNFTSNRSVTAYDASFYMDGADQIKFTAYDIDAIEKERSLIDVTRGSTQLQSNRTDRDGLSFSGSFNTNNVWPISTTDLYAAIGVVAGPGPYTYNYVVVDSNHVKIKADVVSILNLGTTSDTAEYKGIGISSTGDLKRMTYWPGSGGGGSALSALTAATAANSIDNTNYTQTWDWSTLGAGTGLLLNSTSTAAASNTQKVLVITTSGANATASQTTYGLDVSNTKTGTTNTNVAARFSASGAASANNFSIVTSGTAKFVNTYAGGRALIADVGGFGSTPTLISFENSGVLVGEIVRPSSGGLQFTGSHATGGMTFTTGASGGMVYNSSHATLGKHYLQTNGATRVFVDNNGMTIGSSTAPTAKLFLPAGTATANTAPLKFTTGTALTTPEDGAVEYHSSHLYFTIGSTRYQLDQQGGSGETNDGVNLGGGLANFDSKSGVNLQFNTFAAADFNLATNLISLDYTNGQAATSGQKGFLTSTDWSTFNGKEAAYTETTERFTGSTSLTVTVANTPKTNKARIVFFNGVLMDPDNVSITGSGFTISGITRETSDIVVVKYSY